MSKLQVHHLKCKTKYFLDIVDKKKSFEIRFNDRGYCVNDLIVLYDYEGDIDLNRCIVLRINYLLVDFNGLKKGYVALGVELLSDIIHDYDICGERAVFHEV